MARVGIGETEVGYQSEELLERVREALVVEEKCLGSSKENSSVDI